MAVEGYHPCVRIPVELKYLVLNAQVGDVLTHRCQQALDRGMIWGSSEEGPNLWAEFYKEERNWTDYAAERIWFYLDPLSPPPPEEDIWL